MLSLMRKHAQSWLIKVTLGAIIVVFIFWYGWNYRDQRSNRIAYVNGTPILLEDFRSQYQRLLETYREEFGKSLDAKLLDDLNLKKQALDQLITRLLLIQEAGRLGFAVTDDDLSQAIAQAPAFQVDGRFDPQIYQRVLTLNMMTPEQYEETKKDELLVAKVQDFIEGSVKVSDAEEVDAYNWLEGKISLEYVVIKPDAYDNIEVAQQEVETYFSEHKESYELPAMMKARYLFFDFKTFEAKASVSDEEISTYFDLNKEQYSTPKKVRARHILFKVASDANVDDVEKTRTKALAVLKEARSGASFEKLAGKHSEDPGSKREGGDLGFFTKDRMIKPFSDAAFSMKPGEISEPVRTSFGWHIIKVEAVEEARDPVLEEASDRIRSKLGKEAGKRLAFDQADQAYETCYQTGNLSEAAKVNQLEVHETDFFPAAGPVAGIRDYRKFAEAAFLLNGNDVSEPLEMSDGYYILQKAAEEPAKIPDLKQVEERVRQDLIEARKEDKAKQEAAALLGELKGGVEFQKAADGRRLKVEETGFFGRYGSMPKIGFEQEVQEAAFLLGESKPLPESAIKGRQGYYVFRFKAGEEADPKGFEEKKAQIRATLAAQKRQQAFQDFADGLRGKGEVAIQEGFLD